MPTAVVTGANRGIGLALCRQLQDAGYDVFAVCRTPSAELKALDVTLEEGIDVTSDADVDALAKRLAGRRIDLLINNAGVMESENPGAPDFDGIRRQFEINALGPLRVTLALLGNMGEGAKVAHITSRMGSIGDNTSGGKYGYRMSKAALNMMGKNMALNLAERGIAVAILHPGFVRTGMTGQTGHVDPEQSARGLLERIAELSMESSGTFWHANGEVLPW